MEEIRGDVNRILRVLLRIPDVPKDELLKTSSPLALTEKGKKLSKSLRLKQLAEEYAKESISRFGETADIEEYQVYDQALMDAKVELMDHPLYETLKKRAYEHGVFLESALDVLSIELRDCYIEMLGERVNP